MYMYSIITLIKKIVLYHNTNMYMYFIITLICTCTLLVLMFTILYDPNMYIYYIMCYVLCINGHHIVYFQDNQLLRNLLEMVNSRSLQTCDMCREEGENHAATYCCIKCEEFLCDECAQMHKRTRITSDHMVVNVGSMMDVCRGLKGYDNGSMINSRLLSKFGRHGNALFYPISICVNMADDILISNDNNTISIFTLSGSCKKVLNQQAFYGSEKNVLPNRGITVTSEGYVAVALRKDITPQVAHMGVTQSLAGREISLLSAKIKNPRDCQPHGIAITPDNYTVISDIGRNCVYVFDPELQMVRCFGKRGSKGRRQFKTPYFVAVTPTGDILVSDYGNHCVKVFDLKGKPRFVIGRMGKRPGEFVHPMGICTDRYGNIFVADRDNHRVQMFSGNGRFLGFIIERTCKDGQDIRPQDVAITTHGHLVVLLRGIEGIDMAEVHLYQYGSSHPSSSSSALSARDVVSQRDVKPDVPRRLQPISPDGREPSLTPDLLTPATKVKDRHMAEELLAMYQAGKPMNKDQDSQICTIL